MRHILVCLLLLISCIAAAEEASLESLARELPKLRNYRIVLRGKQFGEADGKPFGHLSMERVVEDYRGQATLRILLLRNLTMSDGRKGTVRELTRYSLSGQGELVEYELHTLSSHGQKRDVVVGVVGQEWVVTDTVNHISYNTRQPKGRSCLRDHLNFRDFIRGGEVGSKFTSYGFLPDDDHHIKEPAWVTSVLRRTTLRDKPVVYINNGEPGNEDIYDARGFLLEGHDGNVVEEFEDSRHPDGVPHPRE